MVGVLLALMVGCSVLFFHTPTRYASTSPDGKYTISFGEKCGLADCMVPVWAQGGWFPRQIALGNDCVIGFIHVAWVGRVAVSFVDGQACPDIKLAYDFETNRVVDSPSYESKLKESIIRSWNVSEEELESCQGDALKWAKTQLPCAGRRAYREFQARYPMTGVF